MSRGRTTDIAAWPRRAAALLACLSALPGLARADEDDDDYDPLPGRTDEQIELLFRNFDEVVETITLYASVGAVLAILLGLSLSLRLHRWAAYMALTIVSTVWLAFFEQQVTGVMWIGVALDDPVLVVLGFAVASAHMLVAALSIRPGAALGRSRPALLASAVLIWGALALVPPDPAGPVPALHYAVAALAVLSHGAAIPSFLSLQGVDSVTTRNGVAFAVTVAVGALVAILFGELGEGVDAIFLLRVALIALVGFYVIFFVRHGLSILYERDANARRAVETALREAAQSEALLEAERKYSRARESARRHTLRMAQASHDILQPIASLRSTMDALTPDRAVREQLVVAFDYLEDLANSYRDIEDVRGATAPRAVVEGNETEDVDTGIIVSTLDRMFREEAEAKGLTFMTATDETALRVRPLILTRILSNLLSNAIEHTPDGVIRLTGEAAADGFRFLVSNSAPLPAGTDGAALFEPFVKGEASEGSGLGLSIVDTLSKRHGWTLTWESAPEEGTRFRIVVPYGGTAPRT